MLGIPEGNISTEVDLFDGIKEPDFGRFNLGKDYHLRKCIWDMEGFTAKRKAKAFELALRN